MKCIHLNGAVIKIIKIIIVVWSLVVLLFLGIRFIKSKAPTINKLLNEPIAVYTYSTQGELRTIVVNVYNNFLQDNTTLYTNQKLRAKKNINESINIILDQNQFNNGETMMIIKFSVLDYDNLAVANSNIYEAPSVAVYIDNQKYLPAGTGVIPLGNGVGEFVMTASLPHSIDYYNNKGSIDLVFKQDLPDSIKIFNSIVNS